MKKLLFYYILTLVLTVMGAIVMSLMYSVLVLLNLIFLFTGGM